MKIRRLSIVLLTAYAAVVLTSCSEASRPGPGFDQGGGHDISHEVPRIAGVPSEKHPLLRARHRLAVYRPRCRADRPQALDAWRPYYQEVPVEVTTVLPSASRLVLSTASAEGHSSSLATRPSGGRPSRRRPRARSSSWVTGSAPPSSARDDLAAVDVKGKVAVILNVTLPEGHPLQPADNRRLLAGRAGALRDRGAAAVVTVISEERETRLMEKGLPFDLPESLKFPDVVMTAATRP